MTRIIAIASGGHAVGKTTLSTHLALQLTQRGQRVCLLDAGFRENGVCEQLSLRIPAGLLDVVRGEADIAQAAARHEAGFDIVVSGLDEAWAGRPQTDELKRLAGLLAQLDVYDIILIDCASSFAQGLLAFLLASPEVLLMVTPAAESLSESYSLLKLLYSEHHQGHLQVVVNNSENQSIGRHSYDKFREIAKFYLDMQLPLVGLIDHDPQVEAAVATHSLVEQDSPALAAIDALAERLVGQTASAARLDSATFADTYLQCAGVDVSVADSAETIDSVPDFNSNDDLYRQLDTLSGQVDHLISEVARLRQDEQMPAQAGLVELPSAIPANDNQPCSEACIAAIASETETVTVRGETFPIYHLQKPDGQTQRFAFQTLDDGIEEPEPQTTSS